MARAYFGWEGSGAGCMGAVLEDGEVGDFALGSCGPVTSPPLLLWGGMGERNGTEVLSSRAVLLVLMLWPRAAQDLGTKFFFFFGFLFFPHLRGEWHWMVKRVLLSLARGEGEGLGWD